MNGKFYYNLRAKFELLDAEACYFQIESLISSIKENHILNGNLFKHPLGFYYSIIHKFENQDSFRLHIWMNDIELKTSPLFIHNHYYTVTSFVIMGQITNTTYKALLTNEKPTHAKYIGSYINQNERILKRSGQNYIVTKEKEVRINSNNIYQIFKTELHNASVKKNEISCTLVLTSESEIPNPIVFGDINGNSQYNFKSELVAKLNSEKIMSKLCLTKA